MMAAKRAAWLIEQARKVVLARQEHHLLSSVLPHVAPGFTRALSRPAIGHLLTSGDVLHTSSATAVSAILGEAFDEATYITHAREYAELEIELASRYEHLSGRLSHATSWGVHAATGHTLYSLIRAMTPRVVLETGVANGHSTFLVLNALRANGTGVLYSTDIDEECGGLLDGTDRRQWNFRLLKRGRARHGFRDVVREAGKVDLFYHDSDHSYAAQHYEYQTVRAAMQGGSIFGSDDVDASYAFVDFCRQEVIEPTVLLDGIRVVGFARL